MATEISSVPHGRRDVARSLPTPRSSPSTIMSSSILGYGSTVYPLNTQMSPRIVRLPAGNDTWLYEGALSGTLDPPTGSAAQPSSTPRPPATDQHPPHPPLPHSPPSKIKLLRDVCIRFPSLLSRNNFRPRHTIADCNRYKTDSYILWRSRGLSGQSGRGMTKPRPVTWPELLDFQSRIVGRRQAVRYGVTRAAVGRRIRSGAWQRLHRGTYATFSGVPPREARLWAALVRAGSGAVLSYETAAEVHRLVDKPSSRIHVTVPIGHDPARRSPIRGVTIHRSRNVASEPLPPWQLPRTHPPLRPGREAGEAIHQTRLGRRRATTMWSRLRRQ